MMYQIKALEDLIIAVMLSKVELHQTSDGTELHFTVEERKHSVIQSYIKRFRLNDLVEYDSLTNTGRILTSLNLRKLLRDWTKDDVVDKFNPEKLRLSTYFLWIALFARKEDNNVYINSTLGPEQKKTLCYLFNNRISDSRLRPSEARFQIKNFYNLLILSLKEKRPIEESGELNYLLPSSDREKMTQLIMQWEEEYSNHAYL
ncbi:MAG: hypothetical protein R3267_06520 [Paenisporosarcina sp.]|nr:hypothetical protein [Paenisporosarcina sp.]